MIISPLPITPDIYDAEAFDYFLMPPAIIFMLSPCCRHDAFRWFRQLALIRCLFHATPAIRCQRDAFSLMIVATLYFLLRH